MKALYIFLILIWTNLARVFQTQMKFSHIGNNAGWVYLDKMTFAPGKVQMRIRTQPSGIPYGSGGTVTIQAIPQYFWEHEKQRKCQDVSKQPFIKHKISVSQHAIDFSRKDFQIQETTLYYFVLKDCQKSLFPQYDNKNLNLHLKLHLLNNDRQIGEEEDHWYILPVILIAGVWLVYFYNQTLKKGDFNRQIHKIIMFGGIATQLSSLTWKTFGFLIYIYTGSDYGFFHIIYLFMHSVSQSLVMGLIIAIGFGWTINFMTFKDIQLWIPIFGSLAFINAILTLLTKLQYNEHDRHHIFDSISGNVLFGYRLVLFIVFITAIIFTYNGSKSKVKRFILLFSIFGGIYIAALPMIILVGNHWFQAKNRHEFVFISIQTLKCITNIGMSLMLNNEKSSYNQVSYEKRSFLPEESKYF